jgi:hypothetical protein
VDLAGHAPAMEASAQVTCWSRPRQAPGPSSCAEPAPALPSPTPQDTSRSPASAVSPAVRPLPALEPEAASRVLGRKWLRAFPGR